MLKICFAFIPRVQDLIFWLDFNVAMILYYIIPVESSDSSPTIDLKVEIKN